MAKETDKAELEKSVVNEVDFDEADRLRQDGNQNADLVYGMLKSMFESSSEMKGNTELLWRLARACYDLALTLEPKNPKKKELLVEGQQYAVKAYNINNNDFNIAKWAAALTGAVTDYLGTKEKIEQGKAFKIYLDQAISLNPEDYSIYHMRGRYAFGVASLTWIERKIASTLFATPPVATYEEAISDFIMAEKFRLDGWLENRVYLARSYLAVNDKTKAVEYLKLGKDITPADESDKHLHSEIDSLLKKHDK